MQDMATDNKMDNESYFTFLLCCYSCELLVKKEIMDLFKFRLQLAEALMCSPNMAPPFYTQKVQESTSYLFNTKDIKCFREFHISTCK